MSDLQRLIRLTMSNLQSHRSGLNRRPPDYESGALPLSYCGTERMPWSGLEPLRLSAPPPQDGVSTSFTTRALQADTERYRWSTNGADGARTRDLSSDSRVL